MTIRDPLLPVFDAVRSKIESFGLRQGGTLTIRRRTWTGRPGATDSTPADVDLTITPRPKIREVSMREIGSSGGVLRDGALRVSKITPAFAGGGYTVEQLRPAGAANVQVLYIVAGPQAGEYELADLRVTENFGYEMLLNRRRATP